MMRHLIKLVRLAGDRTAAVTVEFALLAVIMIGLLLGVLQVGIGMQNYNAVRNVTADVARYTMVQYETGNTITNSQIQNYAVSTAKSTPYLLDDTRFQAIVANATTQRVTGARELTLTVRYRIPIIVGVLGMPEPQITYERPIFIVT